jgi:predicted metal-dependent phosphoesterase TrpH
MPARQPFTALCQLAARGPHAGRADLHLHSTHSDGTYTHAQLVDLARRCGLAALAVTDHDTLSAVPLAQSAARGCDVEVVSGVEITAEYRARELHLLAYFIRLDHEPLTAALAEVRGHRLSRFHEMVERLRRCGVSLEKEALPQTVDGDALGRRHLAQLLVKAGRVGTVREAFARYLKDGGPASVPKRRLPVDRAIALVRGAGGVAAWAHPPYDCCEEHLTELRGLGLGAVEAEYPDFKRAHNRGLRALAQRLGLAVTGGSDCHGPGRRAVGSSTVSADELDRLRQKAG